MTSKDTVGYFSVSDEDFEFVATKPLFAVALLGYWILKVNAGPKGEMIMFLGPREGVISAFIPIQDSDYWGKVSALLDEVM